MVDWPVPHTPSARDTDPPSPGSPALRGCSQACDLEALPPSLPGVGPAQHPRSTTFPSKLSISTCRRPTFFHRSVSQKDVFSVAPGQHHSQTVGRAENPRSRQQPGQGNLPAHVCPSLTPVYERSRPRRRDACHAPLCRWPHRLSPREPTQHFCFLVSLSS